MCLCFRRYIQIGNETINAFRIAHKHFRSIKCQNATVEAAAIAAAAAAAIYCCRSVLYECIASYDIALCCIVFAFSVTALPLLYALAALSFSHSPSVSLFILFWRLFYNVLLVWFRLFISSVCVVVVVVVIKLITLNLYAEIHDIFLCLYGWHNFHSCEFLGNSNTWIFWYKKRNQKQES